eukprot:jgi/Picsp_1/2575/NSC_00806-R1_---NA---
MDPESESEYIKGSYGLQDSSIASPETHNVSFSAETSGGWNSKNEMDRVGRKSTGKTNASSRVDIRRDTSSFGGFGASVDGKSVKTEGSMSEVNAKARLREAMKELQVLREMTADANNKTELISLLSKEKAHHEMRNAKTLALLQSKDGVIEDLSDQLEGAMSRVAELEQELVQTNAHVKSVEDMINEVEEEKKNLETKMEEMNAAIEEEKRRHAREVEEWRLKVAAKDVELEESEEARQTLESHMEEVASALDAAEEIMQDMENKRAKDVEQLQNKCAAMDAFIADKLGIKEDAVEHLPSITEFQSKEEDMSDSNKPENRLVKANRALEKVLLEHAIGTKRIGVSLGNGGDEGVAIPSSFKDEVEIEEESMDSLKEELNHMRHAYQMAQQVALQAESQLMAALDREEDLKSALERAREIENRQNVDDDERETQEEAWRQDAMNKILDLEDECEDLRNKLGASEDRAQEFAASLDANTVEKSNVIKITETKLRMAKDTVLSMHDEIQSLREEAYNAKRELSSKEAQIASMEAAWKISVDMASNLARLQDSDVDPTSRPIEYLAESLKEAAQIQSELLASLGEVSHLNEHSEVILETMQKDMDRLRALLADEDVSTPASMEKSMFDRIAIDRQSEIRVLQSQLEKSLAIQHGQSKAYATLASNAREKEAELRETLEHALQSLRENKEFVDNIAMVVAALKSSLARIVLVEKGEKAANDLLNTPNDPYDILELSVTVSNRLNEVAQSLALEKVSQRVSGGLSTGKSNPAEMGRMKMNDRDVSKLNEDYRALLSAYEAAKSEADHAKAALQELKQYQVSNSASKISTPSGLKGSLISSLSSPTSSLEEKDGMLQFVDQFESVLDEVKRQDKIIKDLKDKISDRSTQNWSVLVAKASLKKQVGDAWKEAKSDMAEMRRKNMEHLERIRDLEQDISLATDARDSSSRRYELVKARYDQEIENIKEIYEAQLSALKSSSESEGLEVERRVEEAMYNASSDAERRCREEYEEHMASLHQEIDSWQEQCQTLRHEKDVLEQEFEKFKKVKDASIDLLEQRLNVSRKSSLSGIIDRKDALTTISNVCRDDAVRAAVQEAQLERLERQKLEQEMQELIETHSKGFENIPSNRVTSQRDKKKDFQDPLTRAEEKIRHLENLLQGAEDSTDKEEIKRWQQEANQLQNEIVSLALHMPKNH